MDNESIGIGYVQDFIRELIESRNEISTRPSKSDFTDGMTFEIDEILSMIKASLGGYDSISEMEEMKQIH